MIKTKKTNKFMNIYSIIKFEVQKALELNQTPEEDFAVETPKIKTQGDISLNVALVLSKRFKKSPDALAKEFLPKIEALDFVLDTKILNGFINIFLKPSFIYEALTVASNENYGLNSALGNGEKINVEYCSANPTGPIHIGHTRGTIYGDILSELLSKNGYNVTREYYINDAGGQINTLLKSVFTRYRQLLGEQLEVPEGCYPGEYLIETAKEVILKFGKDLKESDMEGGVRTFILDSMISGIKRDLKMLKVEHDVFTSEKRLIENGEVEKSIDILNSKGLIYKGILQEPKGKANEDWEPREQLLFKSTLFGDSEDRALKKSDGSNTYFSSDVAYHKNKLDRGFNKMVLVLGADHIGYVSRIIAATKALASNPENLEMVVKACQIVKFLEDGQPVKMSKRKGTFTTLGHVIEEVNPDILRFILLTKKNDSQMEFDLNAVKAQTKENPIFYIQYAYSRGSSLLRNFEAIQKPENARELSLLNTKSEMELILKILEYPKVMEAAVRKMEPHLLAHYLHELVTKFHSLWNEGNENHDLRFIVENRSSLTGARLFLVKCVLNIIKSSFNIFKITPLEKM